MRITKTSLFLLGWLAVLLTGCASTPMSTKDSLLISDTQVFPDGKKFLAQDKNSGQIIIKRDGGFTGSACSTRIYIDAKAVADLDVTQKVVLNFPAGEYIVSAEPNGICGGGLTEVKATVKEGSQSVFRYGTSGNGSPSIYPTAF